MNSAYGEHKVNRDWGVPGSWPACRIYVRRQKDNFWQNSLSPWGFKRFKRILYIPETLEQTKYHLLAKHTIHTCFRSGVDSTFSKIRYFRSSATRDSTYQQYPTIRHVLQSKYHARSDLGIDWRKSSGLMCPWTSSSNSEKGKGSDICYHFILSCLVLFLLYDISFNESWTWFHRVVCIRIILWCTYIPTLLYISPIISTCVHNSLILPTRSYTCSSS